MKKSIGTVLFLVISLLMLGPVVCAADPAQPGVNSVILSDFEDFPVISRDAAKADEQSLKTDPSWYLYDDSSNGKKSKCLSAVVSDAAHGSKALEIKWVLDGWCGVGLTTENGKVSSNPIWDWSDAKNISFWAKSVNGKKALFTISINDKGNEQFKLEKPLEVHSDQWTRIEIPMDRFTIRKDWQPDTAVKNGIFDNPGITLEFVPVSSNGDVLIDLIEINN